MMMTFASRCSALASCSICFCAGESSWTCGLASMRMFSLSRSAVDAALLLRAVDEPVRVLISSPR